MWLIFFVELFTARNLAVKFLLWSYYPSIILWRWILYTYFLLWHFLLSAVSSSDFLSSFLCRWNCFCWTFYGEALFKYFFSESDCFWAVFGYQTFCRQKFKYDYIRQTFERMAFCLGGFAIFLAIGHMFFLSSDFFQTGLFQFNFPT